jgi:hypothetical protein
VTREIALTLGVTVAALALFMWNRLRVDVVGLLVMTSLIVLGLVTPRDGISGFANEATVTVALMLASRPGCCAPGRSTCSASRWRGSPGRASCACSPWCSP